MREKLIGAARKYTYQLDDFLDAAIELQIAKELEEIQLNCQHLKVTVLHG